MGRRIKLVFVALSLSTMLLGEEVKVEAPRVITKAWEEKFLGVSLGEIVLDF